MKGCIFSPPSLCPVPTRGREARKRNLSIALLPTPLHFWDRGNWVKRLKKYVDVMYGSPLSGNKEECRLVLRFDGAWSGSDAFLSSSFAARCDAEGNFLFAFAGSSAFTTDSPLHLHRCNYFAISQVSSTDGPCTRTNKILKSSL